VRSQPKGRQVDPKAREEIRALLGNDPRRRDLLIEYLHRIQDRYGHLSAAHLVALADEMKLSMTEVYEVATFYHHFDVIKEGDAAPRRSPCACATRSPARWPDRASSLRNSREFSARRCACCTRLHRALRDRSCSRRRQNPLPQASVEKVVALVKAKSVKHPGPIRVNRIRTRIS